MGVSAMEPINTRSPAAAARGYLTLEWPLVMGHRHRPRQGCTCGAEGCAVAGAHPLPVLRPLETASLAEELEAAPGAGVIAVTERFDAVLVPRRIGMAAMVLLDRDMPTPCLVQEPDRYALLVLPSTGRHALAHEAVEVRSGPEGWVAVPPSRGVRWDTPPWYEGTTNPRPLMHGQNVGRVLAECFHSIGASAS